MFGAMRLVVDTGLRARAQQELGAKFDQRQFYDAVLKNGALPLDILEQQVNACIARKKA